MNDWTVQGMKAAILNRGLPEQFPLNEAGRHYRGLSLSEMARECLSEAGIDTRSMSRHEVARRSLVPGYGVRSGGMATTSDFPNVLADAASKSLLSAYAVQQRTFTSWARKATARDFKAINRIKLGEAPKLERVGEHGEYKRGSIVEGKETYRLAKWGKVLPISWEVIVNDDVDAMTRIPAMFGTAAASLESDIVYSVLLANANLADGVPLFHASHNNLGTGALAIAGLGAARAAMRLQRGLDGATLINVAPKFVVVPPTVETAADQLLTAITPATTATAVPPWMRGLVPVPEPRLETGVTVDGVTYAGSSAVWYLAADPAAIDSIEYCYLEGEEGVQIDTRTGFDVDGLEIKARLVFAAAAMEHRGLYKSTGV